MNNTNTHITTTTYTLQQGDTLHSIANKFGLEESAIRYFHNEHSSLKMFIPFDHKIPNHVLEIVLPIVALQKNKSLAQGAPLELKNQNSLFCDFRLLNHTYGVVLHLETQKEEKRIHYSTALNCTKEFEFVYNLTLHKNQVYIDYKAPNMLAEDLANSLAKPLYPIEVQIGRSATLLGVTNQPQIQQRWEIEKPKLSRYFKSAIAEEQINAVDAAYKNRTAIEKALQRDLFFSLYFSGLYTKYFTSLQINNTVNIPIYPFLKGIKYDIKQSVSPFLNANGNIVMQQTGEVSDSRSTIDIAQNKDKPYHKGNPLEGELDIEYEFCNKTYIIKSITGTISFLMNKKLQKKITIEAYQLI